MKAFDLDGKARFDKANMLGRVYGLPEQMEEAVTYTKGSGVTLDNRNIRSIVVTGLGGSAVGGDLLRSYAGDKCAVPIVVNRGYELPQFVREDTLVFAVSYSGNTEETLSAYEEAKKRGAQIVAITSGGELSGRALADGFRAVLVPGGLQPRAAMGYLFIPQVVLLSDAGIIPPIGAELMEAVVLLKEMREKLAPTVPTADNLAKQWALRLHGRIPLIHGAVGLTEAVAYRWKTQLNENAQSLAFAHVYPELNHNEVVGFDVPDQLIPQMEVVTLRTGKNHPRIDRRIEITTAELIEPTGCGILTVQAEGESELAQMFSLLYYGDYVSTYLALCYGIDPSPVEKIERLKRKLADR
ncbi:MAG TPA: bifunctional phosphoglucose/phosphomannose isomerase [Bacilli bacterium]|nr:bifunctional phosphoglucose/phosphomannose isomerase [Bacilli bacterium]